MSTLFAFLHHLCAFTLVSTVAIEFALIRGELTLSAARPARPHAAAIRCCIEFRFSGKLTPPS